MLALLSRHQGKGAAGRRNSKSKDTEPQKWLCRGLEAIPCKGGGDNVSLGWGRQENAAEIKQGRRKGA